MEENNLLGLVHVYDKKADETTVSWSYKDSSDLKHFVLEYYDENKMEWIPYDSYMGIIEKEEL